MTLIDQAVMRAFQRREQPSAKQPGPSSFDKESGASEVTTPPASPISQFGEIKRELFVHAPETLLRGVHHPRHAPMDASFENSAGIFPTDESDILVAADEETPLLDPAEPDVVTSQAASAVETVMNSLLSYELSIQGPHLDNWQIATETPRSHMPASPETLSEVSPEMPPTQMAPVTFKPAWETDAFRITEMCRQIQSQMHDQLSRAAATLGADCFAQRPLINITGCGRAEGRTTVSILLARELAKTGLRVLLVDGDFENPDLGAHLGVAVDRGWNARMSDLTDVAECCVHSLADDFSFLSLDPMESAETAVEDLPKLLHQLASQFDVILVDSGLLSTEQMLWPTDLIGAHIVVRDRRRADEFTFEHLIAKLIDAGPSVIRVVENFAPPQ